MRGGKGGKIVMRGQGWRVCDERGQGWRDCDERGVKVARL
jgi:hypothetical protein